MNKKTDGGLWLTDFDGTIKPGDGGPVAEADLAALRRLGALGWRRAVATGRSLFGFAKAWQPGLELDYLIFSSGAGLCSWSERGPGPIIEASVFEPKAARQALQAALNLKFGFFAYHAPPDNHHFYHHRPPGGPEVPAGFDRRLELFRTQCSPWGGRTAENFDEPLSQVMIMVPAERADAIEAEFRRQAPGLSVIRSSSPFGDGCLWLEIFPPGISKSLAAASLTGRLGLDPGQTVALGNDYNDRDLLNWAGRAFITADAPADLRGSLPTIAPAGDGGLAEAVEAVLGAGKN